jgi:hypothetical protein
MSKKRYTVRAIKEEIVETVVEATSPIHAILIAEERGKWGTAGEPRIKYTIQSARPA